MSRGNDTIVAKINLAEGSNVYYDCNKDLDFLMVLKVVAKGLIVFRMQHNDDEDRHAPAHFGKDEEDILGLGELPDLNEASLGDCFFFRNPLPL